MAENMTESEAVEKLKAYHKCQRLQVKGIYEDCNEKLCDDCDLCYMQGTAGEHIKSIEIAIQALEKQMKLNEMGDCYIIPKNGVFEVNGVDVNLAIQKQILKKPIFTEDKQFSLCPCCDMKGLTDKQKYCDKCGQAIDWSDEE